MYKIKIDKLHDPDKPGGYRTSEEVYEQTLEVLDVPALICAVNGGSHKKQTN